MRTSATRNLRAGVSMSVSATTPTSSSWSTSIGGDLKTIIEHYRKRNQVFPVEEALLICVKICEGLDYAHNCKDEDGVSPQHRPP